MQERFSRDGSHLTRTRTGRGVKPGGPSPLREDYDL